MKNKALNSLFLWIKCLIFLSVIFLLFYTFNKNENINENYLVTIQNAWTDRALYLILTILLIFINLSLEAVKWKFLVGRLEKINFKTAIKGILAGISIGFITPHGIGDYAARILTLSNTDRTKSIGTVFICRISQFYITLYFGTATLIFQLYKNLDFFEGINIRLLIFLTAIVNLLFSVIYIYHKPILTKIQQWNKLKKLFPYIEIINQYSYKDLNLVLLLSLLRYLTFSIQFILLLLFFGIELPLWILFMGISFVFFVKSVIPTFFDMGIREFSALFYFGFYSVDIKPVLYSSLSLWFCNIAFPALLGLWVVFKLKITKNNK